MTWEWPTLPDQSGEQILLFLFLLFAAIAVCFVCCYKARLPKRGEKQPVREREIIRERVLVVCPFCSAKVEQGTSFCPNCGGKI